MALDEDGVRYSALVFAVDAIKNGTTTLFDHHASPSFIDGSLDVIGDVIEKAGLRGVLCYEVTDRNGPEGAKAGIDENVRIIKKADGNDMLGAAFGETSKKHPGPPASCQAMNYNIFAFFSSINNCIYPFFPLDRISWYTKIWNRNMQYIQTI